MKKQIKSKWITSIRIAGWAGVFFLWGGLAIAETHTWTSTAGTQLEAKFAGIEGEEVLLEREGGDVLRVRMEQLQSADRERARRLTAERLEAARAENPNLWLPVLGQAPHPNAFAVFEDPAFDFVILGDGQGVLLIKDSDGNILRPGIRLGQFGVIYRQPGKRGMITRRVMEVTEGGDAPVRNPQNLVLKGMLEDEVRFERRYRFQPGGIEIDFELNDPRNLRFPSHVNIPIQFARTGPLDNDPDLEPRLAELSSWTMTVHHERRETVYNYRNSFEGFPRNIDRMVIRGPWGERELTLSFPSLSPSLQRYPLSPLHRGFGLLMRTGGPQPTTNRMSMSFSVK